VVQEAVKTATPVVTKAVPIVQVGRAGRRRRLRAPPHRPCSGAAPRLEAACPARRPTSRARPAPRPPQDTLTGAVKSAGVDLDALQRTAATAAQTATDGAAAAQPYVNQAASFLSSSTPVELAEYGAGAAALYLLGPSLLGLALGGLRGYAGGIGPVQALEALNEGAVLIDIRSEVGWSC
jgi:hypothetical protein